MPSNALNERPADEGPVQRLDGVIREAIGCATRIAPDLADQWKDRRREVALGRVETRATYQWLLLQADYWGEKERVYASFLLRLASSFKGAGEDAR